MSATASSHESERHRPTAIRIVDQLQKIATAPEARYPDSPAYAPPGGPAAVRHRRKRF
jgi:hypothetical protein